MNCNTCRLEMSQCLDGRLPSGRRAVVMQHTDSCEPCAGFWAEFQAAQRLSLQLPREQVGESFRDQLWARIHAGEGTPDAVFREPVPTLLKMRYALTGAAAAAALLLFGIWLQNESRTTTPGPVTDDIASREAPPSYDYPAAVEVESAPLPVSTMLSATRPLTSNLVATETARQIEARYDSVNLSLRQLGEQQRHARQPTDTKVLIDRILTDVGEMRAFAEVLFDLREREQVSFQDQVGAELRLVTSMVEPMQLQRQNIESLTQFVGLAVKRSPRLGQISRHIRVTPVLDPHEEAATLIHLNTLRPEVFPKLFVVFGQGDEISLDFGLHRQNHLFLFHDVCGSNFVAPRSEIERVR